MGNAVFKNFGGEMDPGFLSAVVSAYERSGLSQSAFCREWGIPYARFKSWVQKEKMPTLSRSQGIHFKGIPNNNWSFLQRGFQICFTSQKGDVSIMIPPGFDGETLSRLMDVVATNHPKKNVD